jgi:hypothetical protein
MRNYYELVDINIDQLTRKKISKSDFYKITNKDIILSYGPIKIIIKLVKALLSQF